MKAVKKILVFNTYEVIGIIAIIILSFTLQVIFLTTRSLQSDESMYMYAGFAIDKGILPYKEIQISHPPLSYLLYALFIRIFGNDYVLIRLCITSIFLITIPVVYCLTKGLYKKEKLSKLIPFLSTSIYALYPPLIFSSYSAFHKNFLDVLLILFCSSGLFTYLLYYTKKNPIFLFISGLFLGCGLITTFRALFFIAALYFCHIISNIIWNRNYKIIFNGFLFITLGLIVPIGIIGAWLFHVGALKNFFLHTLYIQTVRSSRTLEIRLQSIIKYLNYFSPLLVLALAGSYHSIHLTKKNKTLIPLFPVIFYSILSVQILFYPSIWVHYFSYLTPFLTYLGILGLFFLKSLFDKKTITRWTLLFLVASNLLFLNSAYYVNTNHYEPRPYDNIHNHLGKYIAELTSTDDKIWTSEGAIAFFADRLIVSPNSTDWPVHSCYTFIFAHYFEEYIGYEMKNFKEGTIMINQFIQSWNATKTKILIFILGDDWVPYPDNLLWNGFRNQMGVEYYVKSYYDLYYIISSPLLSTNYYIWIRKSL